MTELEFLDSSKVTLIQSLASDEMVCLAAWVSNGWSGEERLKEPGRIPGLINFLYRERHSVPFEHGIFTFKVETPIFVAREFYTHRTFSRSEMSGRYTVLRPRFYVPGPQRPLIQTGKIGSYTFEPGEQWQVDYVQDSMREVAEVSWRKYENLRRAGVANEVARMVLPLNIFTEFYASVNPWNLMKFLHLRSEFEGVPAHAMYEIRKVARAIQEVFAQTMPHTYAAFMKDYSG